MDHPELAPALMRLVALARSEAAAPPWDQPVDEATVEQMRATLFILDASGDGADVTAFVGEHLGRVAAQLRRTTAIRSRELRGRVRGMIDWPSTAAARLVQGGNPTYFVCRDTEFFYDTPENQLLFFLVEQIERGLAMVPRQIRAGLVFGPGDRAGPAAARLEPIAEGVRRFRRETHSVRVTLPRAVGHEHIRAAERSSLASYRSARVALAHWERTAGWGPLFAAASRVLPVPATPEPGDPWMRLAASVLSRRPPPDAP